MWKVAGRVDSFADVRSHEKGHKANPVVVILCYLPLPQLHPNLQRRSNVLQNARCLEERSPAIILVCEASFLEVYQHL